MISKLLRIYKRTYGVRQICNIAVYIAHSACTIHLLNLPEKNAVREIVQGVKYLEEIAESWLCARRTLAILDTVAQRWKITLPDEAVKILQRTKFKFRQYWEGEVVDSPKTPGTLPINTGDKYSHNSSAPPRNTYANTQQQQKPKQQGLPPLQPITSTTQPTAEWDISPRSHQKGLLTPDFPSPQQQQQPNQNQNANHYHHQQQQQHEQPRYLLPLPAQSQTQQFWPSQQYAQQAPSATPSPRPIPSSQPSPSALFGGVDAPAEESTHWWLNDQANFFDNWYAAGGGDALAGGLSPAQVHEIYVGDRVGVGVGDGGYGSRGGGGYKYDLGGVNGGI